MKKLLLSIVILIGLIFLVFIPKIIPVGPGIEPGTKEYRTIIQIIVPPTF